MEREEYFRMDALEGHFWWYRALHADMVQLLEAANLQAQTKVLDAGCGTGGLLATLEKQFPDWELTGIEQHGDAIPLARAKSGADILQGDVARLPFDDQQFDLITNTDVLYHRNVDETATLNESYRCLKPGGLLLLSQPAYEWMRSGHDRHVHTARRYTARGLRDTLASAGFTRIRCGYRNSLLFPLMLLYRLTAGQGTDSSDVRPQPAALNSLLYAVTGLERFLARTGLRLPFGGSVWAQAYRHE